MNDSSYKKAFLSDQCKEIEETNRMGKSREISSRKLEIPREHFKDGHNKRKSMDPTEAEDIKNRWQEYTGLYKKDINDPDNHNGVITHLELDILRCISGGPSEVLL